MRDEKLHAVVARSTFGSQNVQNTSCSDDFWKLRCRKSERWCGAKHISKPNVEKTEGRSDVVLRGRRKGFCTLPKMRKTRGFCSSFNYNHHYTILHYTTTTTTITATTTTTTATTTATTLRYTTLH